MHTASQSLKFYTSDFCVRLGIMWPSHSSLGKAGKSIKHGFFY